MKTTHIFRTVLVALVIVLAGAACSPQAPSPTPTPQATPTLAPTTVPTRPATPTLPAPTAVPTRPATPTLLAPASSPTVPAVALGKEIRFEEQGFSFQPLPEYQLDTDFGVQMLAPGADPDTGPAFMLAGGRSASGTTAQSLIDTLQSSEVVVDPAKQVTVSGLPGLSADFKRTTGDLLGRVVVVMVNPDQQFMIFAAAPANLWESEVSSLFDALLASVKLFEMTGPAVGDAPTTEPTATGQTGTSADLVEIRQWASGASASSSYGDNLWNAGQATGAPDSPLCADQDTAWASVEADTVEWIELTFGEPVIPQQINVYLNYNPTYITKMELFDIWGEYRQVYSFTAQPDLECPAIFSVDVTGNDFQAVGVKITIDQSQAPGWVEIDAVEMVGLAESGGGSSGLTPDAEGSASFLWRLGGEKAYDTHAQFPALWGIDYDPINDVIFAADSAYGIQVIEAQSMANPPEGQHLGQFEHDDMLSSQDVKVDAKGKVYVAAWASGKVLVFAPMGGGEPLVSFGERGTGDGQFGDFSPSLLAVGLDGRIYVNDTNVNENGIIYERLQIFSSQGKWLKTINYTQDIFSAGGMDIGPDGNLYILGFYDPKILKYSPDGILLAELGEDAIRSVDGGGQGIALDARGNIYLALWIGGIVKLDSKGNLVGQWGWQVKDGDQPWPEGCFYRPTGIAVTPDGSQVFFSDTSANYTYLTAITFK